MSRYVRSYFLVPENPRYLNVRYGIKIIEDVPYTRAKMTMMSQRKSIKWFLTMIKEKKIMTDDVHLRSTEQYESRNVFNLPLSAWLPFSDGLHTLIEHMKFHTIKVLLSIIKDFLKPVIKSMPCCITLNCDLVEASKNLCK